MPVLVHISSIEAEALETANVAGYSANTLTYDPAQSVAVLNQLPVGEARDRLSERMGAVAVQLGIPDVMFTTNVGDALEVHGAIEMTEADPMPASVDPAVAPAS